MLFGDQWLDLTKPHVMGVINVTPDSFSDGGSLFASQSLCLDAAMVRARAMVAEGASFLDIGGESTRPGANPVSVQQELDRVIPVIEAIRASLDVVVSIDTSTPEVITAAAKAGAGLINDVRALGRSRYFHLSWIFFQNYRCASHQFSCSPFHCSHAYRCLCGIGPSKLVRSASIILKENPG